MSHKPIKRRAPALAVMVALLALGVAACAGSGDGGTGVASLRDPSSGGGAATTTTVRDPEDAALDYVKCMREHGIDMPDPQVGPNGETRMQLRGRPGDESKLKAAEQACAPLLKPKDGGKGLDPAMQDAMLKFAKCMRDHGIDMPDPTPGQGGVVIQKGRRGVDPDSAKFKAAERACDHFIKDARSKQSGGAP
jgi:hypothetical protein